MYITNVVFKNPFDVVTKPQKPQLKFLVTTFSPVGHLQSLAPYLWVKINFTSTYRQQVAMQAVIARGNGTPADPHVCADADASGSATRKGRRRIDSTPRSTELQDNLEKVASLYGTQPIVICPNIPENV